MKTNYARILKWNNTIAKWRATGDVHEPLNFHQIKFLEKKIAFPMGIIINKSNELAKKYFELDETGQVKYTQAEEGKESTAILLEGMKREDYDDEMRELYSTEIDLKL